MDLVPSPDPAPELSVVIKALNEAEKIGACIRSVLAVTDPATTEIIVADSLSEDATVAVAAQFPVRVVQLARREDRGCGTAAQLGFQHARGKRLLLLDGDMELDPKFLPAAARALDADPSLAGVGGLVIDRVMTLEFQRRAAAASPSLKPGYHKHLAGGGLFRMDAVRRSGYFTDRNLHAFEELELGTRLSAEGWRLLRLDLPAVHHHGHAMPAARLLWHRWRTRYVLGQGELLRATWGTDRLWRVVPKRALQFRGDRLVDRRAGRPRQPGLPRHVVARGGTAIGDPVGADRHPVGAQAQPDHGCLFGRFDQSPRTRLRRRPVPAADRSNHADRERRPARAGESNKSLTAGMRRGAGS
jgi:GT2 family glycosyltransferase